MISNLASEIFDTFSNSITWFGAFSKSLIPVAISNAWTWLSSEIGAGNPAASSSSTNSKSGTFKSR